ncbi:MAG TPA: alpha/beta fold hydrolase [Gemmatimonadaceae bacterium]|nr:alpha/beta fold hydrolase [Gemmatimonadaceae bacterium]
MIVRFSFLFLLAGAAPLIAQSGGVTHVDTVPAPSLRGNLVGDPDWRQATVYLPPGYSRRPAKRYPVVYLLHGFAADHRAFMKGAYQNLNVRISMDSLIRARAVREMIVVMPNARSAYDGSFYANSVVTGNWEDFIVRDLVGFIDRKYRTIRGRSGRGVAGHSMGGFGALRLGMRHPETFSAVYALSPCCLATTRFSDAATLRAWRIAAALSERGQFVNAGFTPNRFYAEAAIYSPDSTNPPFYVRLPYRLSGDSLVLDTAVARNWRATPLDTAPTYAANLRRVAIAFDAGSEDGLKDIPVSVRQLDSVLTALRVPHSAELYEGTHGSRIRLRLESKVFPFFSQRLH